MEMEWGCETIKARGKNKQKNKKMEARKKSFIFMK